MLVKCPVCAKFRARHCTIGEHEISGSILYVAVASLGICGLPYRVAESRQIRCQENQCNQFFGITIQSYKILKIDFEEK
jgi:hypothetical protein